MRRSSTCALIACVLLVTGLPAQAVLSYGTSGSSHTESFDSLASTGTNIAWSNDATLPGWYAFNSGSTDVAATRDPTTLAVTQYNAGNGGTSTGKIWSFGAIDATERALGSIAAGSGVGDFCYALVLQNTTGEDLTAFTLAYTGEQWRAGAGGGTQRLDFDYRISSTFAAADLAANVTTDYQLTGTSILDFASLVGSPTGGKDGNAPAFRTSFNETITGVNWTNGSYLVLRWWDDDGAGSDHGLAIDDLQFSAVPEPASIGLLCLAGALLRRRDLKN